MRCERLEGCEDSTATKCDGKEVGGFAERRRIEDGMISRELRSAYKTYAHYCFAEVLAFKAQAGQGRVRAQRAVDEVEVDGWSVS